MMNSAKITGAVALSVVVVATGYLLWQWHDAAEGPAAPGEAHASRGVEQPPPISPAPVPAPVRAPLPAASKGPVVAGIVFGPGGQPEAAVRLVLQRMRSPWPALNTEDVESTITGGDGRFAFRTVRGPDYRLVAEKVGLARTELEVSPLDPELVVRLSPGFMVEGVVEDPKGHRLPNCEVILEPSTLSAQRAIPTITDRFGRFRFSNVGAGAARLTARRASYRPAMMSVAIGTKEVFRLRFTWESPLALRGSVIAAANRAPVAGAVVRAYPSSWNSRLFEPVVAQTGKDGKFVLLGLGLGNLRIETRHPDYSTRSRLVTIRAENPEIGIEMIGRSRFSGKLTGPGVHAGLALRAVQEGELRHRAVVDDLGRFSFDRSFSVGTALLALDDDQVCFDASGSRSIPVDIEDDEETVREFKIAAAGVVRGEVRDEQGRAIPGVRVMWNLQSDGPMAPLSLLARSDDNGAYEVRGLPRAGFAQTMLTGFTFVFEKDGFATQELRFSGVGPGASLDLPPVVLLRPGTIHGRVTRAGRGVAGAVVFASRGIHALRHEVSGADGGFTLTGIPPGDYRLKVRYATMPLIVSDEVWTVAAGASIGPVDVPLPEARTITGRVVGPDGSGVSNALIVVRGLRGAAFYGNANGEFTLDVPEDDIELSVFADTQLHELRVHRTVRVPLDQSSITIELPMVPSGTVVGRVLGLPGRTPLAGGIMRVESLDPRAGKEVLDGQRNVHSRWIAMSGGELRVERFPAGRSRLTLQCQGFAPFVDEIDVAPGQRHDLGSILLEPGAMVRGVVVDSAGEPLAGARVFLGDELDRLPRLRSVAVAGTLTAADGSFQLSGVSPDADTVVVSAEGYATQLRELVIPDDLLREDPMRIAVHEGATIEVKVKDGKRHQELTMVFLKKDGELRDAGRADERGMVRFRHQSPGNYEVFLLDDPESARSIEVGAESLYQVELTVSGN